MIASIKAAAADVPLLGKNPGGRAAVTVEANRPRKDFASRAAKTEAYVGGLLGIGWKQPISEPHMMAIMTAAGRVGRGYSVLEIGTGSGYQAGHLTELVADVSTIEIVLINAQHRRNLASTRLSTGSGTRRKRLRAVARAGAVCCSYRHCRVFMLPGAPAYEVVPPSWTVWRLS